MKYLYYCSNEDTNLSSASSDDYVGSGGAVLCAWHHSHVWAITVARIKVTLNAWTTATAAAVGSNAVLEEKSPLDANSATPVSDEELLRMLHDNLTSAATIVKTLPGQYRVSFFLATAVEMNLFIC